MPIILSRDSSDKTALLTAFLGSLSGREGLRKNSYQDKCRGAPQEAPLCMAGKASCQRPQCVSWVRTAGSRRMDRCWPHGVGRALLAEGAEADRVASVGKQVTEPGLRRGGREEP